MYSFTISFMIVNATKKDTHWVYYGLWWKRKELVFLPADLRQSDHVIAELIRNSQNQTEIQGMTSLEVSNYMSVCACGRDHVVGIWQCSWQKDVYMQKVGRTRFIKRITLGQNDKNMWCKLHNVHFNIISQYNYLNLYRIINYWDIMPKYLGLGSTDRCLAETAFLNDKFLIWWELWFILPFLLPLCPPFLRIY